jgi:hypothetical protein
MEAAARDYVERRFFFSVGGEPGGWMVVVVVLLFLGRCCIHTTVLYVCVHELMVVVWD